MHLRTLYKCHVQPLDPSLGRQCMGDTKGFAWVPTIIIAALGAVMNCPLPQGFCSGYSSDFGITLDINWNVTWTRLIIFYLMCILYFYVPLTSCNACVLFGYLCCLPLSLMRRSGIYFFEYSSEVRSPLNLFLSSV